MRSITPIHSMGKIVPIQMGWIPAFAGMTNKTLG